MEERKFTKKGIVRMGIVKSIETLVVFGAILIPMGIAEMLCRLCGVG